MVQENNPARNRTNGTKSPTEKLRTFAINIRHAPVNVTGQEKDQKKIADSRITWGGKKRIIGATVPFLIKRAMEESGRKTVIMVRSNENRDRTKETAAWVVAGTRKALRKADLHRQVKVFYRGHADILDTVPPLKARVDAGDSKEGAAYNWIVDNEETQAARDIEPPGSVYKRIVAKEVEVYENTINKQPAINQKKHPGRIRPKTGSRFSAPQLNGRNVTVIHVGVTHENFHGAILKKVASVEEALKVDYLEPLEIRPINRGRGVIYVSPPRRRAYLQTRR